MLALFFRPVGLERVAPCTLLLPCVQLLTCGVMYSGTQFMLPSSSGRWFQCVLAAAAAAAAVARVAACGSAACFCTQRFCKDHNDVFCEWLTGCRRSLSCCGTRMRLGHVAFNQLNATWHCDYLQDKFELLWHEDRSRALLAALRCTAEGPALGQVRLPAASAAHCGPLLSASAVTGHATRWTAPAAAPCLCCLDCCHPSPLPLLRSNLPRRCCGWPTCI